MSIITHKIPIDTYEEREVGFVGWTMLVLLGASIYFLYGVPIINTVLFN